MANVLSLFEKLFPGARCCSLYPLARRCKPFVSINRHSRALRLEWVMANLISVYVFFRSCIPFLNSPRRPGNANQFFHVLPKRGDLHRPICTPALANEISTDQSYASDLPITSSHADPPHPYKYQRVIPHSIASTNSEIHYRRERIHYIPCSLVHGIYDLTKPPRCPFKYESCKAYRSVSLDSSFPGSKESVISSTGY